MSHWGSASSQTLIHTGIPWSFVKADIPRTETSRVRTGQLDFWKCSWSRVLKPLRLAERSYDLITTFNFQEKNDAASLKDFFFFFLMKKRFDYPQPPIPAASKLHLPFTFHQSTSRNAQRRLWNLCYCTSYQRRQWQPSSPSLWNTSICLSQRKMLFWHLRRVWIHGRNTKTNLGFDMILGVQDHA